MPKHTDTLVEERPTQVALESPIIGHGLAQVLQIMTLVVDRRSSAPILECVHLVADGKHLTVSATDLDHFLSCKMPYDGIAFDVIVPARPMLAVAEAFGGEIISFCVSPERLILWGSAGEFTVRAHPTKDKFPQLTRVPPAATLDLDRVPLISAITKCRAAISREETRYYLNGICFTNKDGKLELVATDGHRLHSWRFAPAALDGEVPQFIIHRRAIQCLVALLEQNVCTDIVMETAALQASFAIGDWTLTTKCIDGTYPDYSRVIPTEAKGEMKMPVDQLAEVTRAIKKLNSESVKALSIHRGGETSYRNPEGLSFTRSVSAAATGQVPELIGFNVNYLADMLATHLGDEVTFSFPDESGAAPTLIKFAADEDFTGVLMPMRV